jgi:drug/metabolite transporter (DMT)-like permease
MIGHMPPDRLTLAAFVGVVLLGGSNAVAVKLTVPEVGALWSAALRFVVAGAIVAVIVVATRRRFPRGRALAGAAVFGALGLGASYGFIYSSIPTTPVGTVMVLIALTPLMTFGLAIAHGQERFRLQGLLGALIALGGIAVVFADQVSANVPVAALVLVVLGAACIAESAVIVKLMPRSDPFGTNAVAMLTGGALLLLASVVAGETPRLPAQPSTWLALGYLIVLGSIAMFALYLYALTRWTASAVSYGTLLFPLITVPVAAWLLGELVTPALLVGGAVIVVGVYVGAFLTIRPRGAPAVGLPECLAADCGPGTPAPGQVRP